MSKSAATPRRKVFLLAVAAAVLLTVTGISACAVNSLPALSLNSAATPAARINSFAYAEIVKPTYTALPTQIPTSLPTETPATEELQPVASLAVESVISAEIVPETAALLGYSATTAQDAVAAPGYGGNKYILVDISEQHMYVYEGDVMVYSFVASTGMNNATRVGTFSVLEKIPNAYGATWDIWIPNWLGIYWAGSMQNGIHALPILPNGATLWAGYLGTPISYGCVVLGSYEAQVLYDWADVGTPVEIRW